MSNNSKQQQGNRHSPLTSALQPYCPVSVAFIESNGGNFPDTFTSTETRVITKSFLPLSSTQSGQYLNSTLVPIQGPNNLGIQLTHQCSKAGIVNGSSLSDSSSLSSSLISLHSSSGRCLGNQQLPNVSPLSSASQSTNANRDSRWLKLRLCRSFDSNNSTTGKEIINTNNLSTTKVSEVTNQDSTTTTVDGEPPFNCALLGDSCPYAHPSPKVRIDDDHVTICYDFIKRKSCKYYDCKYYHPPAHQIEAILRRGDEQKKLQENQNRLKTSNFTTVQPMQQQPLPNGLVSIPGPCGSNPRWPSTPTMFSPNMAGSLYGHYLANSTTQSLPVNLGPSTPLTTQESVSLPTPALLAAAVALQSQQQQQHQQGLANSNILNPASGLPSTSTFAVDPVNSKTNAIGSSTINGGLSISSTNSNEPSLLSLNTSDALNRLLVHLQASQWAVGSSSILPAIQPLQYPPPLPPPFLPVPQSLGSVAGEPSATSVTTTGISSQSISSVSTAPKMSTTSSMSTSVRTGIKREANHSDSYAAQGLDMHVWLPSKRSNILATPTTSRSEDNSACSNGDSNGIYNGKDHFFEESLDYKTSTSMSDFGSSLSGTPATCPLTCPTSAEANLTQIQPNMSSLLNPLSVNLYGIPLSAPQSAASPYGPSQFIYPALYSPHTSMEVPTPMTAAAMALNNFLVQQQAQTQPTQLIRPQLPVVPTPSLPPNSIYQSFAPNTALAAVALANAHQQQQSHQPTPELHATTHQNPALQQQQQAVLLSFLLRAQQSQQAQYAAAAAAANAGFLPPGSVPGALTSLSSSPYPVNFCPQNLITNVAYINEKGNLLETLPICRDFKAGKCHRNADCRYVHLVDENVEVTQGRVIVCRDAAKGRCTRMPCKYYHIPLFAISANRSMALNSALATAVGSSTATNI